MTINEELPNASVLAINLRKTDSGSGVREVDLYKIVPGIYFNVCPSTIQVYSPKCLVIAGMSGDDEAVPVVSGSVNDIVILPLSEETQFTLFTSSVDNVGNRRPLRSAMRDYIQLDFPVVFAMCPRNCSNNGNCSVFGDCLCEDGFYGSDCSQGKI